MQNRMTFAHAAPTVLPPILFGVSAMKCWWLASCFILSVASVSAHVNDRGMDYESYKDRYGGSCCDNQDCRSASDFIETVANGEPVVRLQIDGVWITVSHAYMVDDFATDGRAHYCGQLNKTDGNPAEVSLEPICVILPPHDT